MYRLSKAALYCGDACLAFVEFAEGLQRAILSQADSLHVKLLIEFECLLAEATYLFAQFSAR